VEALVARLSRLDSDAEGAMRVVTFYDTLIRRRVDLPALARASAGLAECVTGVRMHGSGRVIRMSPDGGEAPPSDHPASTTVPVVLDDEEIGTVWLERSGPASALDLLLLERFAIAVASVAERYGPANTTMADPALVELVISCETDDAARDRALRLLGFRDDHPVHVMAVRSRMPLDRIGSAVCPGRPVKAAHVADVGVVLATRIDSARIPTGVCAGIGSAHSLDLAWREARTALRFTTSREPVIRYDGLGVLALLAQVPPDALRNNADVLAIARIAHNTTDLDTLDAYCATASVRQAAEFLHLHHSSVARRLEQLAKKLGMELTPPAGLTRVQMALTAWRLLHAG
jgi:PucR C-terminal helix-turn-helix domain